MAILSSVHAPDDIRIYRKQAVSLARAGYDVTLVIPPRDGAGEPQGIKLLRVATASGRLQRMTVTALAVTMRGLRSGAQLFHFHDPELMPFGVALKLLGKKVIYDVHEDLPLAILSKHWIHPSLRRFISAIIALVEKSCSRCYDAVIAATPSIAKHLPADRTVVIQNFPLAGELNTGGGSGYAERPPDFAYVGGINAIRGAREMVQAMSLVNMHHHSKLHLAGQFTPASLHAELSQLEGWKHTQPHGFLSRTAAAAMMSACRAGLVLFHPEPNHIAAQPNKLFEYMSAGLPVVASDFPLWREIIEGNQCGLLADPRNPESIAAALSWILSNPEKAQEMGRNGLKAVEEKYTWAAEEEKLLDLYARLLG